jgi:hypothetical protein
MYFGMCNAPVFFQRTMQKDSMPFLEQYRENVDEYTDDWWIATNNDEAGRALHVQAIHDFLDTCKKHSYFLKAFKCKIMQPQITLLGWLVTGEGLYINPSKVTGISEWPRTLTSVRQVHKTLGVLGYQCPFIQGFTSVELTKKGKTFEWTEACCKALEMLI